ncbi:hypothetical protein BDN72DRAFT_876799 [Pluteus cervinus]|uniref:Uncharacterized protein n=1 Tax=Pluteus cervinus TaxID=181527 RepID=A0ACD3B105_9AGAR|nr:hypothetical protein BDN72DRAFT_876799 [Pluteus cervinus]
MLTTAGLPPFLLRILRYNPDFIPPVHDDEGQRQPDAFPFVFHDRHLSPELSLARVVIQPSIPTSFMKNIDTTLDELKTRGMVSLPLLMNTGGDYGSPVFDNQVDDDAYALKLAWRYSTILGNSAPAVVSRWALHPDASKYYSTLRFGECKDPPYQQAPFSSKALRFQPFQDHHPEVLSLVSDQFKDALRSLEGRGLVIYQFYSMSTAMEQNFRDMDGLEAGLPSVVYKTGGLTGSSPGWHPPCDARNTPWLVPDSPAGSELRCSVFQPSQEKVVPCTKKDRIKFDQMDSQTAAGLCYHAWHQAVIEDATVIVFHCGNFERIGIRHRKTQTLILSSLIEVSKCQDPAYGELHVGLMLAAVQDALDRHEQSYQPQPTEVLPRRKAGQSLEPGLRRSKRQRTKVQMASLTPAVPPLINDDKAFWKMFAKCPLALVRFDFECLRSPCPAACLRRGGPLSPYSLGRGTKKWKKSYSLPECCTLTLDSYLAKGATGRVHTARLEIRTADGKVHSKDVIVKTAVEPHLRKRIRGEYSTYQHLWEHRVDRIPMVHGLFEDIDDMVTLLVIEKFKMSFRDREPFDLENEGLKNDGLMLGVTRAERYSVA